MARHTRCVKHSRGEKTIGSHLRESGLAQQKSLDAEMPGIGLRGRNDSLRLVSSTRPQSTGTTAATSGSRYSAGAGAAGRDRQVGQEQQALALRACVMCWHQNVLSTDVSFPPKVDLPRWSSDASAAGGPGTGRDNGGATRALLDGSLCVVVPVGDSPGSRRFVRGPVGEEPRHQSPLQSPPFGLALV